jgi:hypothetical protein
MMLHSIDESIVQVGHSDGLASRTAYCSHLHESADDGDDADHHLSIGGPVSHLADAQLEFFASKSPKISNGIRHCALGPTYGGCVNRIEQSQRRSGHEIR